MLNREEIAKIWASIDEIKSKLGNGELVTTDRASGKTTALLEFIHEYCCGLCAVITVNETMAELMEERYRLSYPEDEKPRFVSLGKLRRGVLRGSSLAWLTDEVLPEYAVELEPFLTNLTYLGGVGSWKFMAR